MPRKGQHKVFRPTEPPIITAVKKLLAQQNELTEKRLADMAGYLTGALEQLMFQQGQQMTVQAAILQYLNEQLAPGAEAQIRSLMEQNIAKMKAEREEREKALNEEAAKRRLAEIERVQNAAACDDCGANLGAPCTNEDTAGNPCPARIEAAAPPDIPEQTASQSVDTGPGEEDRPPTFHAAPSAESDQGSEPGRDTPVESPADIAPEPPADAPADPPGT